MNVQHNVSKFSGAHKLESSSTTTTTTTGTTTNSSNTTRRNLAEASEETNDSSSDEGTEDSTDNKAFKPKPGKLDLSQFDNITNAIGKLNVHSQAPIRISEININSGAQSARLAPSFQINHPHQPNQALNEELPFMQYSGFFRGGKGKKQTINSTKNRLKESPHRGKSNLGLNSIVKQTASEDNHKLLLSSPIKRKSSKELAAGGLNPSIEGEKLEPKNRSNSTPASSSSFHASSQSKSSHLYSGPPPHDFSDSAPIALDYKNQHQTRDPQIPKPAPRTSTNSSNNAKASISPSQAVAASTTGSSRNAPMGSAPCPPKRVGNPRQNHGRAVAPPQLPDDIRLIASTKSRVDSERPTYEVISQLSGDDGAIDFSQSPIAQRLLRHTKDYKVSELNSPYESDCEPPQPSVNLIKFQKLQRGQSFISESNSPVYVNSCIDSSELINSRGAAIRQLNEILANKQAPGRPGGQKVLLSRGVSGDKEYKFLDDQLVKSHPLQSQLTLKDEKDSKKDKKKSRDDEKLEKRRLKEEERVRRQEKKLAAKKSSKLTSAENQVDEEGVPPFIRRCIEFIEYVGLDAEGIYRVPGNRAHVDTFVQKFKENSNMSIVDADIPVNAVATALKDFLSKKWGPIIPATFMNELTDLAHITDKGHRVHALRQLVKRLPPPNYKLLKYLFSHFVKVSLNHSFNSMDSKNLAICWWPTLLPLSFSDMVMFEQMRPHLEETVQTLIDKFDYIFDSEEPNVTAS